MRIIRYGIAVILILNCLTATTYAQSLSSLYERISDSVVMIQTVERGFDTKQQGQAVTTGGIGSGVIISDGGLIMTAAHVVPTQRQL